MKKLVTASMASEGVNGSSRRKRGFGRSPIVRLGGRRMQPDCEVDVCGKFAQERRRVIALLLFPPPRDVHVVQEFRSTTSE